MNGKTVEEEESEKCDDTDKENGEDNCESDEENTDARDAWEDEDEEEEEEWHREESEEAVYNVHRSVIMSSLESDEGDSWDESGAHNNMWTWEKERLTRERLELGKRNNHQHGEQRASHGHVEDREMGRRMDMGQDNENEREDNSA
jgi:hypothetical protein